ncbi:MAG TPA: BMP family ABC transporter substrate-binding protein [Cyanobacteria bacterium UBA8530]|nr:BMP family ABC transporter substrate-binding protein [Cyanobacteria bacterium UBA8530]
MRNGKTALAIALSSGVTLLLSGCQTSNGMSASTVAKYKVVVVMDTGSSFDDGFNLLAVNGMKQAQSELGVDVLQTKYVIPNADGENREELLLSMARENDLVFALGYVYNDLAKKAAARYPNVKFAVVDGDQDGLEETSNLKCLLFKEQEGSYLVGVAAALKSNSGKIGFIGGGRLPVIERFEAGYLAGAKSVNPQITVLSEYAGSFDRPDLGASLATQEINAGADVIYQAAGTTGTGVLEAAADAQKLCIGVDIDQTSFLNAARRPYLLTSMIKKVDMAVYTAIKDFVGKRFKGGKTIYGLSDGAVGYVENDANRALLAPIKDQIEAAKAKIVAGTITVPSTKAAQ